MMLLRVGIAFAFAANTVHTPDGNTLLGSELLPAFAKEPSLATSIGVPDVQSRYMFASMVNRSFTTVVIDGPPLFKAAAVCCISEFAARKLFLGL